MVHADRSRAMSKHCCQAGETAREQFLDIQGIFMRDESYKVILEGTLRQGFDRAQAIARLAKAFKQDAQVTERLLSGKPRIIRKGLDYATARKYQETLEKMGAASHMEPESSSSPLPAPEPTPDSVPSDPSSTDRVTCPRCGYEPRSSQDVLLVRGDCPKCGLIVKKPDDGEPRDASPASATEWTRPAAADDYADVDLAPFATRMLASIHTFGLFLVVYICIVIGFMLFFFPLPNVPYQLVKNFLYTAYSNFPMLLTSMSIFFIEFLIPFILEGRTLGQKEFGIGILFTREAETGGLILSQTFRVMLIGLLSYSPGLLFIKIGGLLGYEKVLHPYHTLIMVLMAISAWTISWIVPLFTPHRRGLLDIATGTIQSEEKLLPPNALVKAGTPLAAALAFMLVFGLVTPLFFR
jgi:hypothetical protein